jgi:hypothetical protein
MWSEMHGEGVNSAVPAGVEPLIVVAASEVPLGLRNNHALVAVDLSRVRAGAIPDLSNCHAVRLLRLPGTVQKIGVCCFEGWSSVVAVDLGACERLTDVDLWAFRSCYALKRVVTPPSPKRVRCCAFRFSGLEEFDASASDAVFEGEVFYG